jgi:hypothetical protein
VARLVELSHEINDRQIAALADVNHQWRRVVDLRAGTPGGGIGPLPSIELQPRAPPADAAPDAPPSALDLRLTVQAIDAPQRRVRVNGTYFGFCCLCGACKWLKAKGVG